MKKIKPRTMFCYSIGNLGYGTVSQTLNSFVMFFATSVLSIPGTLVGLAVAISTLWDGVSDPLIGDLSDRSSNRLFGKRINYMFFASFGIAVSNILIWIIPSNLPVGVKFAWLVLNLLLLETFNTAFATPYVALGIDLVPDYNQQSALQGYKTIFLILGMIMPSILMMIFMPSAAGRQAQFNQSGYILIGLVTSALCLLCGLVSSLGCVKSAKKSESFLDGKPAEKHAMLHLFAKFFKVLKSKTFGPIIFGYSVALISSAILISVGMHLFTYCYHFDTIQIPSLMAILFVAAILSQPVWIFLSNRLDKKPSLNLALTLSLLGIGLTAVTFVFRQFFDNKLLFGLVCPCIFVCGFGTGALYSLPVAMFADALTLDRIKTGQNNSATYSGFLTLAYNISNSISLLIIGILLDVIKFDANQPVQALSVQNALGILVFAGCSLAIGLSIMIFSKYKIKRSDVLKAQMRAEIKKKKVNT